MPNHRRALSEPILRERGKTQIWYVPAIIKKKLQLDASLYTCLAILKLEDRSIGSPVAKLKK